MSIEQLPLFPDDRPQIRSLPSSLTPNSPLSTAVEQFRDFMVRQDFAQNTINSFLGDLSLFRRRLNQDRAIGQVSTKDLRDLLHWLQYERGRPCSSKSYARRLTTLKVFFGWLADTGVLPSDPAAALSHKPVQTPLPQILYDDQVEQVLAVTRQHLVAEKPDARPHLLVTLLLHTGIKKQECMSIKLAHIDTSDPQGAVVHIRYDRPQMQYKERRLRLPSGWAQTLAQYRRAYEPQEFLFPCTARNLEYVLTAVAKEAGLPASGGLSFEMLRWTCAVRDYRARMDPVHLRRKLGLSEMSWQEVEPKIVRLAEPPL